MRIKSSVPQPGAIKSTYKIRASVWRYEGFGGWHFVNIPAKQSTMIRALYSVAARPFGSIPVLVTIGKTEWKTSLFPDKKSNSYLLAIKADVRKKENIENGDTIAVKVQIL